MRQGVTSFPGKHDTEKILTVIRKHPLVHWIGLFRFLMIAVIPTGLGFTLLWLLQGLMDIHSLYIFSAFLILYFSFFTEMSLVHWLNEELNLIIITDFRAVDITQHGFLRRTIAETMLDQIQDVSGETRGIAGNLLNYGDLSIHTASTSKDFFMTRVSSPHLKSRIILDFVEKYRKNGKAS